MKIHHSNERLRIKFEKELNEKVEELKELKVRYARCIESFNLLRRYHEAPETVFDAIVGVVNQLIFVIFHYTDLY